MKKMKLSLFVSLIGLSLLSACNKEDPVPNCGYAQVPTTQTTISACSLTAGGTINACASLTDTTVYAAASSGLIGTCSIANESTNSGKCKPANSYLKSIQISSNGTVLATMNQTYNQSSADETIESFQTRVGVKLKILVASGQCGLPQ